MQISWNGGSTVELNMKKSKALLNPAPKAKLEDYQVIVYDRSDEKHAEMEGDLMVDWPGEYDVSGFSFQGYETRGKKDPVIAYTFFSAQGNVTWLGEMSEYPSDEFIEALGEVHVLLVPVGGKDVLNAKDAYRLVEALEPLVVIPICYGDDRDGLSEFLKEMDVKMPEAKKSFEFKKTELSEGNMELVLLQP
ncbi:MAG: MBL fold metallo-hydrolase [Candidatus Altimarinota bacterium]